MRLTIYTAGVLFAASAIVSAQDTSVKSRTKIDGDEAQIVSMTGCLRQDVSTGAYMISGTVDAVGERLTNEATLKVDRDKRGDREDTHVTAETKSKADKGDKDDKLAAGVLSTYVLSAGNLNLKQYVGQQVQVAAAAPKPGHKDADVTVREETKVDPEHGKDSRSRSKTEVEVGRGPLGQYTAVSVKPLGGTCAAR
jgi:hypothetical protein